MFMKALASLALMAAPLLVSAYEPVTCQKNATQNIVTSITSATDFCTMLPGYGVYPVAPNEGCASVYCYGAASKLGPPMPKGYILSANYAVSPNNSYVQVTGCIDSSVWGQNPTDEGGQMDSHGWPYSCQGWKKFVSLIEPASNTYCIRCCSEDNNVDCNTSISTKGCWNVVPGLYQMADGSVCRPPAGSNVTAVPTVVSPTGTAPTASGGVTVPVTTGAGAAPTGSTGSGSSGSGSGSGSSTTKPSLTSGNSSSSGAARGLVASNVEVLGALAAAAAVALAVGF
ncbi:hypothetical protein K457DRAFT_138116 [Linnemannia elongata AG-77]|uniref:Secreted protein n=1 Tax=Linnemannia elongata AG-77 TaxID=1314771 RepID=A0A197JVR4_9FUNG|nr:hypothetical protein K457DRAFT_138116 [Linnemannia elongata AG-77]